MRAAPRVSLFVCTLFSIGIATLSLGTNKAHAVGFLVPTAQEVEPLAIRHHRVSIAIRERIAETRVEQVFRNHTGRTLEATYIFPVPEGASVSGFALYINGQRQEGELLESGQARQIYERIVARMQDPGLVEHMGGNLFRARVFPIAPNADQRLEIRFTQTLEYQGSVLHYRYPLHTSGRAARTLEDLTITADIASRTPIRAVYSPSHPIAVARPNDHQATVGFEGHGVTLDQDFDLYYAVQDRDVGLSLLTHRTPGEDGYFLAMIAPRAEVTQREIAAKEVVFVFDTSGSMAGEKMRRAQAALDYMLRRLNPSDHFQVVRFSTDVEVLFDQGGSVPANAQNVARARRFADHFVAAGGTAIQPALEETFRVRRPGANVPRIIVFLTDGMPTVGETSTQRIVRMANVRSGTSRLFAFGVGDDVNTTFLDALAQGSHGVGEYFQDGAELEQRLSAFYDRIAFPMLTDLRLALPGLSSYDVYPRDLGHLYRGGQLLVIGRYRSPGQSRLSLHGRVSNEREARAFHYDVSFPAQEPQNGFIARLWATRKVGYLLDNIRLHGEQPELRTEVIALARRFGIVTPYTSYLVVEDQAVPQEVMQHQLTRQELRRQVHPTPQPVLRTVPGVQLSVQQRVQVERGRATSSNHSTSSHSSSGSSGGGGGEATAAAPAYDPRPESEPPRPAPPPSRSARRSRRPAVTLSSEESEAAADFADFESARVEGNLVRPDGAAVRSRVGGGGSAGGSSGGSPGGLSSLRGAGNRSFGAANTGAAPSGGMGAGGRRLSWRLRNMREAERVPTASGTRVVVGQTYRHVGGMWVDHRYRRSMRTLRIRTLSPAYFAFLRAQPALRQAVALGQRVTLVLPGNRAVIIDPSAPAEVTEEQVRDFLRSPGGSEPSSASAP